MKNLKGLTKVNEAFSKLSVQIKNGIENIVNKFKTNNWKLVFEG